MQSQCNRVGKSRSRVGLRVIVGHAARCSRSVSFTECEKCGEEKYIVEGQTVCEECKAALNKSGT